ncbi:hypothetical protein FRC09_016693, partial [Ceratobasidium sp. 395]
KRKKDAAEEERELRRINAAAEQAYAKDIGSGAAVASSSSSSAAPPPTSSSRPAAPKPPPKPLDKFANYSTAESLGFVDESIAEAERRRTEGLTGDWEVVLPTPSTSAPKEDISGGKRILQPAQTEERAAAESSRNFRVGERRIGAGLEEIWEPEVPIRLKVKSEQPEGQATTATIDVKPKVEIDYGLPKATEMPVWKAKGWSKPGEIKQEDNEVKEENAGEEAGLVISGSAQADAVPPSLPSPPPTEPPVKAEPDEPKLDEPAAPGGNNLFRKRKGAPSTAGTRNAKKR